MSYSFEDDYIKIKNSLVSVEADLNTRDKEIKEKYNKFTLIDKLIEDVATNNDYLIKLNIGGKIFIIRLSQLTTKKDTLFYSIIFKYAESNIFPKEIFFDRNYTYFHLITESLRYNKISSAQFNRQEKEEIVKEFAYYGIELKKFSEFVAIKGVDFCYGDVTQIKVKNFQEAVTKAEEWVISPDRCATFLNDTLWLKNTKLTQPNSSKNHEFCTSFVHGKPLDLLTDHNDDIIQVNGIDLWGGDEKNFEANYEDAFKFIKEWVTGPERCATFVDNRLYLKNTRKTSPKTNTSYHGKCISFLYGTPM